MSDLTSLHHQYYTRMNVASTRNSTPTCQSHQFLMHRPKEDLSLLLQYILKSRNDGQYDDGRQINHCDITVIHYKYGTITVRA